MQLLSTLVQGLTPYVAGEQPKDMKYIKLNTNENAYPPSPNVTAVKDSFDVNVLRRYSDPNNTVLKQALAQCEQVGVENIFVGNGSDEVLAMSFPAFCDREVAFADVTYSFYTVYCNLFGKSAKVIPLDSDYNIRIEDYTDIDCDMIIIANPNAPTGIAISLDDIAIICQNNSDKVVLIDEAYSAFMGYSATTLVNKYNNLLVVKTFSKCYSLAGARCGYAVGNAALVTALETIKNCFNSYTVNSITEALATAAVQDAEYMTKTTAAIIATRKNTIANLVKCGFDVLPSSANFVFAKHGECRAKDLYLALKSKGVLVRYFDKPRVDNYLRITIGTDDEMATMFEKLQEIL